MTDRTVDREYLTQVQYSSDANLAARQAIYRYQQPRLNVADRVLDLAGLTGTERVLDVGCGNGLYLHALHRRRHAGIVCGADLSPGMLAAAAPRNPAAGLSVADAQRLPFADASFDVGLAMHMLYHVPDRLAAMRELRRVVGARGVVLAVTNARDHLDAINQLVGTVLYDLYGIEGADARSYLRFSCENGAAELGAVFESVEHHDFTSALLVTDVAPLVDYVRSMSEVLAAKAELADEIARRAHDVMERDDGVFRVTTHVCCFVCR